MYYTRRLQSTEKRAKHFKARRRIDRTKCYFFAEPTDPCWFLFLRVHRIVHSLAGAFCVTFESLTQIKLQLSVKGLVFFQRYLK